MNSWRLIVVVLAFEFMLGTLMASAQHSARPSASVAGKWNITFTLQGQTAPGTLVLAIDGETLTGTVETHHTGPGKLQDGKFSATKLSATCVFEHHESIALTGELKNEKLVGTFHTEAHGRHLGGNPYRKSQRCESTICSICIPDRHLGCSGPGRCCAGRNSAIHLGSEPILHSVFGNFVSRRQGSSPLRRNAGLERRHPEPRHAAGDGSPERARRGTGYVQYRRRWNRRT
jgi:hypothetical protein